MCITPTPGRNIKHTKDFYWHGNGRFIEVLKNSTA
jgi:hypothetical protein